MQPLEHLAQLAYHFPIRRFSHAGIVRHRLSRQNRGLRSGKGIEPVAATVAQRTSNAITMASATGFAQRAAIAHAVYSPDQRRPVEVGADHEDQLVTWLSKRMGAPMKPPHVQALGYPLDGGRLLP
jgi:anti-sigma factor RsiW